MRSCIFALAVIWMSQAAVAQSASGAPSASEWRQELDQIVRDIRSFHPSPFTRTGELTFLREVEALKSVLPQLSVEQRVVRAMRLVALIGDGHTQLKPNSQRFAFWYPFRLYEFTDGYFVTSAHPSVRELAGAQVLEIAGCPAGEAAEEARNLARTGNAADAEDVTLKAFVKAFHHLDQFRGEASFSTWLSRIAVNESRSHLRRSRASRCESLDEALERKEGFQSHEFVVSEDDPERWCSRQELKRIVWQALDSLPVPYRLVLIVREIYGFSTKEAPAVLAISATAVRIRAFRAAHAARTALALLRAVVSFLVLGLPRLKYSFS